MRTTKIFSLFWFWLANLSFHTQCAMDGLRGKSSETGIGHNAVFYYNAQRRYFFQVHGSGEGLPSTTVYFHYSWGLVLDYMTPAFDRNAENFVYITCAVSRNQLSELQPHFDMKFQELLETNMSLFAALLDCCYLSPFRYNFIWLVFMASQHFLSLFWSTIALPEQRIYVQRLSVLPIGLNVLPKFASFLGCNAVVCTLNRAPDG